ncbi:MAG TPA: hypothetical protein VG692_03085 [Gemmatimonadales bacterium]|nr:hypothetical protein [Gemmatimonadales bacterium]
MRLRSLPLVVALLAGCFVIRRVQVDEVRAPVRDSVQVNTPVKAHMLDGSTVLYSNGVVVRQDRLVGAGQRYGLRAQFVEVVQSVPVDSVVGMETYRSRTDPIASIGLSFVATTVGAAAVTATAAAIFGSCPTFYSDSAGTDRLEAEGFSYSIAPLFEARDVDRLRAGPRDGALRLEVRNEALETHQINQLELLEVSHRTDELVVPDGDGRPLALAGLAAPAGARDRAGRSVAPLLTRADGRVFASDTAALARASEQDFGDYIDLVFPPVATDDSLALVFRLRNSLLNTVLLYDVMLGSRAARALDWQGRDLSRVGPALELGTWYASRMGLRVLVPAGDGFRDVGRVRDTGPIAWKDVGVVIPGRGADSVRVRLAFPLDNWRIDRVAVGTVRRPASRALPLAAVLGGDGKPDPAALASMRSADRTYLETRPGQHFTAVWATGGAPGGDTLRTYLLAAQGYYTEWVRGSWLAAARDTSAFRATDASLVEAMRQWRRAQDSLETRFYASRIPVR